MNTIYELVHASGKQTAYTDKHPAYDMVRGPSGKGLSVGYFPVSNGGEPFSFSDPAHDYLLQRQYVLSRTNLI